MEEDRILAILRQTPDRTWTQPELLNRAGFSGQDSREGKRLLKSLVRQGAVERERGKKYRLSRAGQRYEGHVQADHRGVLYLVIPERSGAPIPIHPEDADRIGAGDRVKAEIVVEGRKSRHFARVLEATPKAPPRRVGVFHRRGAGGIIELDSPLEQVNPRGKAHKVHDLIVSATPPTPVVDEPAGEGRFARAAMARDPFDGMLVEAQVDYRWRAGIRVPFGKITNIIGPPGERATELRKLMLENNLIRPFPDAVEAEAAAFGDAPKEADYTDREDLRNLPLVTIDGETAKDFDDAVCAQRAGPDRFRVFVAIADVSHYVRPQTALDIEAYDRGTSTYLTDRAIPMLPEALSNGLCSLRPKVDRLCLVAELTVDGQANVISTRFYPAVMNSKARLTYTQVAAALDGQPDATTGPLLPDLQLLAMLADKLLAKRMRRGAIDLDLPEAQVVFDDQGLPVDAVRRPRNAAHRLIEDFMLAANEAVARFFMDRDLPTIYRVHEPPDPTRLASFTSLCRTLGLSARLSDNPRPAEIAKLLEALLEHPSGRTLQPLLLRSMSQARYEDEPKGHFGLAADAYLHFTSPIRRYPDLIVHRLLKDVLATHAAELADERPHAGGQTSADLDLRAIAEQSSDRERKAMTAERQALELDRTFLARGRLGQTFCGRITGVQGFGLFVALDDPFLEGLIPVQTLPEDFYEADESGVRLVGQRTGRAFSLGDAVQVQIVAAHVGRRQIELALVDEDAPATPGEVARTRRPPPRTGGFRPAARSAPDSERPKRPFDPKARLQELKAAAAEGRGRGGRGTGRSPRGRGRGRKLTPRGRGPRRR